MGKIAVAVPGIMGSALYYPNSGNHGEIWGEDFQENYRRLIKNPDVLKWTGQTANAKLLRTVRVNNWISFLNVHLWSNSLKFLAERPEFRGGNQLVEFGYDWRAPLNDTAEIFANRLSDLVGKPINQPRAPSLPQFVFLTHSMGGLLVRIALGLNLIEPTWVDRIIHVGSPLKGAPIAFRTAYERSTLPLLNELFTLFHWKNGVLFKKNLLACFKSFPSLYQLMPPLEVRYLYYSPSLITSPLEDKVIPDFCRHLTEEAHEWLIDCERVMVTHKMKVFTIYTAVNVNAQTDLMYRVKVVGHPDPGYLIEEVIGRTVEGDGTVPAQSAIGSALVAQSRSVLNVQHAYLCNSASVVEILATILS
jgi:hypothetical protein